MLHVYANSFVGYSHIKNDKPCQDFSSMYKVESIARNNLKMAAKDEVLIIINQNKEEDIFWQKRRQQTREVLESLLMLAVHKKKQ